MVHIGMGWYAHFISNTTHYPVSSTHAQGEAALQALLSVSNEDLSELRKAEAQLWLDKCVNYWLLIYSFSFVKYVANSPHLAARIGLPDF